MALTHQQNYLLDRLPKIYDRHKKKANAEEPAAVTRARKVIEDYNAKVAKAAQEEEKRILKIISEAREAIYFKPINKALELVRKAEAEFGLR